MATSPNPPGSGGYLDSASTAPLHPAARDALAAALDAGWADPARLYREARRARQLLDAAREQVAAAVGARPDEVSFAPSGTLGCHLAVLGLAGARRRAGAHTVASAVEHSAVLHALEHLAGQPGGEPATLVPVDRTGRVDRAVFAAALRPDTALACLQSANHEVGTVQPVAEVAEACAAAGVPLVVDAAQTVGQLPFDVAASGAAAVVASAHKWGGPAGVGVLVVRKGTRFRSPLPYDEREARRVPGFENVPAVTAAAAALSARTSELATDGPRRSALVDRLRTEVPARVPDVKVLGDPVRRLPHLMAFSCLYVDGEALLGELDAAGFAVSSGSSCTSSTLAPSHVLEAMGVLSHGNVRVSLHRDTTEDEVDRFLDVLPAVVAKVRASLGADRL
jgi:cysteine desulfurase